MRAHRRVHYTRCDLPPQRSYGSRLIKIRGWGGAAATTADELNQLCLLAAVLPFSCFSIRLSDDNGYQSFVVDNFSPVPPPSVRHGPASTATVLIPSLPRRRRFIKSLNWLSAHVQERGAASPVRVPPTVPVGRHRCGRPSEGRPGDGIRAVATRRFYKLWKSPAPTFQVP